MTTVHWARLNCRREASRKTRWVNAEGASSVSSVAGFGAPHRAQLHLAGLGRSIGLFARTSAQFFGTHGNGGAIDAQLQRGGQGLLTHWGDIPFLVLGNFDAQRFGGALDLLGIDRNARQFLQQLATFCKADQCSHGRHHPCDGGRQRGIFQAQVLIARAESLTTSGTMIIGALQRQRPQRAGKRLRAPPGIACHLATGAMAVRLQAVAVIGVEPLCDGLRR